MTGPSKFDLDKADEAARQEAEAARQEAEAVEKEAKHQAWLNDPVAQEKHKEALKQQKNVQDFHNQKFLTEPESKLLADIKQKIGTTMSSVGFFEKTPKGVKGINDILKNNNITDKRKLQQIYNLAIDRNNVSGRDASTPQSKLYEEIITDYKKIIEDVKTLGPELRSSNMENKK